MRRVLLVSLVLAAVVPAVYWPLHTADFTNFDDPVYVTNNPEVFHGLSWRALRWAFTTFHGSNWHPLTWLSHAADCQCWGENAGGHHLTSVAFHAANTVLLLLALWQMTGALWRSAFVAALFALHPLHVESVAWIAERKDVLSTFFGLLSLWAYAAYAQAAKVGVRGNEPRSQEEDKKSEVQSPKSEGGPRPKAQSPRPAAPPSDQTHHAPRTTHHPSTFYLLSLAGFALGLMSKPMLVTLPFLLLLLNFWPLDRLELKIKNSKLKTFSPLLLEKLPFFALTLASSLVTFRAQHAGGAVVTLEKFPFSDRLANAVLAYAAYVQRAFWPAKLAVFYPFPADVPLASVVLTGLALAGVTVLVLALARRAPWLTVGWLWFGGMLAPVIGLVQVGSQAAADRYMYLPLVGLAVAVTWTAAALASRWRYGRAVAVGLAAAVLAGSGICTRFQLQYWQNSIALFSHTLDVTRDNPTALHNLAHALSLTGNQRAALPYFNEVLRRWPTYAMGYFNRGCALAVQGKLEEATADFQAAIRCQPDYEEAYYHLACALVLQSRLEEARTNFLAALRCKPDYAEAHTKLGNLLWVQGATNEAMAHLNTAVTLRPDYEEGCYYLGGALAREGQFAKAAAAFRSAIKAKPAYEAAFNDLAWILATRPETQVRNVSEAIRCAERACELTHHANPLYLDTLAVARSEAGQFSEATALTDEAVGLARAAGDKTLAAQLESRLSFYQAGRSYTQGRAALPRNHPP